MSFLGGCIIWFILLEQGERRSFSFNVFGEPKEYDIDKPKPKIITRIS